MEKKHDGKFARGFCKYGSFALIFLLLLGAMSFVFYPKNNSKSFGMLNAKANGILGESRDSVDVVFVGDSIAYSSFSPIQIWEKFGYTSYVCATPMQSLNDTYSYLSSVFRNQDPKIVILEADAVYRKFSVGNTLGMISKYFFPIIEYHNRWKNISVHDFTKKITHSWTDDEKGYSCYAKCDPYTKGDYMQLTSVSEKIPKLARDYCLRIKELCKKEGAELIIVASPSPKNWSYPKHNGLSSFAAANDIQFIDMNLMLDTIGIDWNTDTRDKGDHLNISGSSKVTSYLASYLSSTGALTDHRGDPAFASWDQAAARCAAASNDS